MKVTLVFAHCGVCKQYWVEIAGFTISKCHQGYAVIAADSVSDVTCPWRITDSSCHRQLKQPAAVGAAMGTLLAVHLGVVLALFVTLPYGKFVHGIYRYAALIRYATEQSQEES